MEHFGRSLRARARGEEVHEGGYQGEYLIGIAERTGLSPDASADEFMRLGADAMFQEIRATLSRFRVEMDVWTSEAAFHDGGKVNAALQRARDGGHLLERDGATWLATAAFGDDKDRVVLRSDGTPTYFAADMAYLVDKLERGFDRALYVLGADHHGYVARLRAGAAALGFDPERVEVPIYQMVHLTEGGQTKRMSKRRGDVVLLDELMDLIGVDAARWYLVSRSHDQTIELDIELAREQSSKNPVYYVQYAHARIAAIERGAGDRATGATPDPTLPPELTEAALVRAIAEFPRVAGEAAELRAPHRIAAYATELAAGFHAFYRDCRVLDDDDLARTRSRLALCRAVRGVLASSLDLLGLDAPEEM
jgi:arginyl-tRNA synthetase